MACGLGLRGLYRFRVPRCGVLRLRVLKGIGAACRYRDVSYTSAAKCDKAASVEGLLRRPSHLDLSVSTRCDSKSRDLSLSPASWAGRIAGTSGSLGPRAESTP